MLDIFGIIERLTNFYIYYALQIVFTFRFWILQIRVGKKNKYGFLDFGLTLYVTCKVSDSSSDFTPFILFSSKHSDDSVLSHFLTESASILRHMLTRWPLFSTKWSARGSSMFKHLMCILCMWLVSCCSESLILLLLSYDH